MSATRYANLSGPTVIKCKLGREGGSGRHVLGVFFFLMDRVTQGLPLQPLSSCLAEFSAAKRGEKKDPSPPSESISGFQRRAGLEVAGPLCLNALPDPRHLASGQEAVGTATRTRFSFYTLWFDVQACAYVNIYILTNKMGFDEGKNAMNNLINKILLEIGQEWFMAAPSAVWGQPSRCCF